jgi:glycosyltransferase involved in cell wall biosynthesis
MKDLSVIIPFVNEHPQVAFTVQSVFAELHGSGIDFEIIVIDNWCQEVEDQIRGFGKQFISENNIERYLVDDNDKKLLPQQIMRDRGSGYLRGLASNKDKDWLRYLRYDRKLSHWQAKNLGVAASDGAVLWFCDAHCIVSPGSLVNMYRHYIDNYTSLNGTLHLPLSYMLEVPGKELVYKLVTNPDAGVFAYSFTPYRNRAATYKAPVMSTCGMMMGREIYETLGGWPAELGIYGGGEHFINFTMAVLGMDVNIFASAPLWHYAAPRGYHWNYTDYHRNRAIATYMFGGYDLCKLYLEHTKGNPAVWSAVLEEIPKLCDRTHIEKQQKMTIQEWVSKWTSASTS